MRAALPGLELLVGLQGLKDAPLRLDQRLAELPVLLAEHHVGKLARVERAVVALHAPDPTAQRGGQLLVAGGGGELGEARQFDGAGLLDL